DLYAGTGAVGMKALDEGASEVVFVEESRGTASHLSTLVARHRCSDRARVIMKKALSFLEWAEMNHESYDILFLDPPYHSDEIIRAMTAIGASSLVRSGGTVIAEHFARRDMPPAFGMLEKKRDYRYGDSVLTVYEVRSFS
ncbi:MAG: RsmD family RNA methyltransferase, partial [Nitrospiraceae bacterium]